MAQRPPETGRLSTVVLHFIRYHLDTDTTSCGQESLWLGWAGLGWDLRVVTQVASV